MRLSAQSKSNPGRFDPDHIDILARFYKMVVALGATTKSYDKWSGYLRFRPLVGFVCDKNVGWTPKSHPTFKCFIGWALGAHPTFMQIIGWDFGAHPIILMIL